MAELDDTQRDEPDQPDDEEAAARRRLRARIEQGVKQLQPVGAEALAALSDKELAARLRQLGFDDDTAPLLPYLPLIQVAWADGSVAREESVRIFTALQAAHLPPGGAAWTLAEALLEERPGEVFLEESRRLLRALLLRRGGGGVLAPQLEARAIVDLCLEVAEASGGVLGRWWRTSASEAAALEKVAETLGPEAVERLRRHLSA